MDLNFKVSDFVKSDHTWNIDLFRQYLPENIISKIKGIHLASNNIEDTLIWVLAPSENFSVKSTKLVSSQDPRFAPMAFQMDLEA